MSELKSIEERDPAPAEARPDACDHANPLLLRLLDHTRYGAWVGCVECGASWLDRGDPGPG